MTMYFYQTSRGHMAGAKLYPQHRTTTNLTYFFSLAVFLFLPPNCVYRMPYVIVCTVKLKR